MGGKPHSKESLQWLEAHWREHSRPELVAEFSQRFRPITLHGMHTLLCKHGWVHKVDESSQGHLLTEEQKQWLLDNWQNFKQFTQMAKAFTEKFHRHTTGDSISKFLKARGISKGYPTTRPYSKEEEDWLVEHLKYQTNNEVIEGFNAKFTTRHMALQKLHKFRIARNIPYNPEAMQRSIRANAVKANKRAGEIGIESRNSKGQIIVKTANKPNDVAHNWTLKKVLMWEQYHNQKLPAGWCVVCLDNNEDNFDETNLYAVEKTIAQTLFLHNRYSGEASPDMAKVILLVRQLDKLVNH